MIQSTRDEDDSLATSYVFRQQDQSVQQYSGRHLLTFRSVQCATLYIISLSTRLKIYSMHKCLRFLFPVFKQSWLYRRVCRSFLRKPGLHTMISTKIYRTYEKSNTCYRYWCQMCRKQINWLKPEFPHWTWNKYTVHSVGPLKLLSGCRSCNCRGCCGLPSRYINDYSVNHHL